MFWRKMIVYMKNFGLRLNMLFFDLVTIVEGAKREEKGKVIYGCHNSERSSVGGKIKGRRASDCTVDGENPKAR